MKPRDWKSSRCKTCAGKGKQRQRASAAAVSDRYPRSLHRAFVGEAILAVLDDGGDGFQRELTFGVLDHVLQIEILDRDVVVAELERAAHRLEIGLFHRSFH